MAPKSRELLDFEILSRLKFEKFGLIHSRKEQIIWIALIIESQVKDFFASNIASIFRILHALIVWCAREFDLESEPSFILVIKSAPDKFIKIIKI